VSICNQKERKIKEFEDMSLVSLRKLLVDTIIDVNGRDYALGWLYSAYAYGSALDENRDHLIGQIREYRSRAV